MINLDALLARLDYGASYETRYGCRGGYDAMVSQEILLPLLNEISHCSYSLDFLSHEMLQYLPSTSPSPDITPCTYDFACRFQSMVPINI
jgi:hypothetical protein